MDYPLQAMNHTVGYVELDPPSPLSSSFQPMLIATTTTMILIGTYITKRIQFHRYMLKRGIPAIYPYCIPFIGHAFSFCLSPSNCIENMSMSLGSNAVFGVKILGYTLYVLTGRQNVATIRKHKGNITDPGVHEFCLTRVFGVGQKAVNVYSSDNSGIQTKPAAASSVAPHNRVDYHTHKTFLKIFSGEGLNTMFKRWHVSFSRRLENLRIENQWIEGPDFEAFWMPSLVASLNEAIAGPVLESVNPMFTKNFMEFYPYAHSLMRGLPKWLIPRAIHLRNTLMRDFSTWHSIARVFFEDSDIEEDDTDRWWGLSAIRDRQRLFSKVDGWDHSTLASLDFGLLWGANLNSHMAAIWMIIEIYKDANLLGRVRGELSTMTTDPSERTQWIGELGKLPLLQSIYAEVLRLRTGVQTVFRDNRNDLHVNDWCFPKKSLIIVPTMDAHHDATYWNTKNGLHPTNRFWSDRFLAYPGDPSSGPSREADPNIRMGDGQKGPKYVPASSSDAWIPYGIGERACPGRHFARREMLAFCAMIVENFDIELPLLTKNGHVLANNTFYGLGILRPKTSIPFRIRRRS